MSNKSIGGYVIVDATGLDVSSTSAKTITGIYNRLLSAISTGKPIMLTGMVKGSAAVSPAYVSATIGTGGVITLTGFDATVASNDRVTPAT